jgi:hypothetical protein
MAFNADVARGLATQFLALADRPAARVPQMVGHRMMGHSLLHVGEFVEARAHYEARSEERVKLRSLLLTALMRVPSTASNSRP